MPQTVRDRLVDTGAEAVEIVLELLLGRRIEVVGQDQPGHRRLIRVAAESASDRQEPQRIDLRIVVREGDDLAGRDGKTSVPGGGEPRRRSRTTVAPVKASGSPSGRLSTTITSRRDGGYSSAATERRHLSSIEVRSAAVGITTETVGNGSSGTGRNGGDPFGEAGSDAIASISR